MDVLLAELDNKDALIKGEIRAVAIDNSTKITNKSISKILAEQGSFKKTAYFAIAVICIILIFVLNLPIDNIEPS